MTAIDDLLSIQITQGTVAATPTNTSLPLIVGKSSPGWTNGDTVRLYDSAAAMLSDGYTSSAPEYLFAQALTSQAVVPNQFLVAPYSNTLDATLDGVNDQNSSWYCLLGAGLDDNDIEVGATYMGTQKKIFLAESSTAAIGDPRDSANIAAQLSAGKYGRCAIFFSPKSAGKGISAAWAGLNLPQTVGTVNWAYNSLAGFAGDALSASQRAACIGSPVAGSQGNNANVYLPLLNGPQTLMGTMASGEYIDVTIGIDWLYFNIQAALLTALGSGKVPYSTKGTALLTAAVRNVLTQAATNGLINSEDQPIVVEADSLASVPTDQRASRRAPTIRFSCLLSGAINSVKVVGKVAI